MDKKIIKVIQKDNDLFNSCPHLKEFKRPSSRFEKLMQKEEGEGKNNRSNYKNAIYKSKQGITYGLYQRFPWDHGNVPFGSSSSNFKVMGASSGGVGGEEGCSSGYKQKAPIH